MTPTSGLSDDSDPYASPDDASKGTEPAGKLLKTMCHNRFVP